MIDRRLTVSDIQIQVQTDYQPQQSDPGRQRFVFAYTITIANRGERAARLLTRHWLITDADGDVQEVYGEGVVGQTPMLQPGEAFEYTSGAILGTPFGTMEGHYSLVDDAGIAFDAPIEAFTLAVPGTLH
jgi:ApaG protein